MKEIVVLSRPRLGLVLTFVLATFSAIGQLLGMLGVIGPDTMTVSHIGVQDTSGNRIDIKPASILVSARDGRCSVIAASYVGLKGVGSGGRKVATTLEPNDLVMWKETSVGSNDQVHINNEGLEAMHMLGEFSLRIMPNEHAWIEMADGSSKDIFVIPRRQ